MALTASKMDRCPSKPASRAWEHETWSRNSCEHPEKLKLRVCSQKSFSTYAGSLCFCAGMSQRIDPKSWLSIRNQSWMPHPLALSKRTSQALRLFTSASWLHYTARRLWSEESISPISNLDTPQSQIASLYDAKALTVSALEFLFPRVCWRRPTDSGLWGHFNLRREHRANWVI